MQIRGIRIQLLQLLLKLLRLNPPRVSGVQAVAQQCQAHIAIAGLTFAQGRKLGACGVALAVVIEGDGAFYQR